MDHFYSQNARLSNIRIPGGTANIPMLSSRVGSPMMSGKLRHKQFSRNSPTDYSSSYLDILRHLQANSASSTVHNIEEGTLVVDMVRDEVASSSPGIKNSRKTMHRIEEPSGSYRGHHWHRRWLTRLISLQHPNARHLPSHLSLSKISGERRTQARAIAEVAATPVVPPRSPLVHGKSHKIILHGDWSPLDDGIQMKLPSQSGEKPSREGVNDCIKKFLQGDSIRHHRRLPVFSQMCSP